MGSKLTDPDSDLWVHGTYWNWHRMCDGSELGIAHHPGAWLEVQGDCPHGTLIYCPNKHSEYVCIDILDALALLMEDMKHEAR